jgi:GTP-binding protein
MLDEIQMTVKGGDGGHGLISFRREKFAPLGGPDGGDGGRGGDVIVRATDDVYALERLRPRRRYEAGRGGNGASAKKHGRNGKDLVLEAPEGTVIFRLEGGERVELADLPAKGTTAIVARGGKGGWGNIHFATSTNQAPYISQSGAEGEEAEIVLELRLISDVGIIGLPNAGKSTLLAALSAARPKVGDYPFTTLQPTLGVVNVGWQTFRMADLPGLIEGAAEGRGLGHEFLRHAMRCPVLLHLADGSADDPVADVLLIREEIAAYDPDLRDRVAVIAVNKVDLPEVVARRERLEQAFAAEGMSARFISAATGEGLRELAADLFEMVKADRERREREAVEQAETPVLRPQPRRRFEVEVVGGEYVVDAPGIAGFVETMDLDSEPHRQEVYRRLKRWGVAKELERKGAVPGSPVRIGKATLAWLE